MAEDTIAHSQEHQMPLWAARNGHAAVAVVLLRHGADVATGDDEGMTALAQARKTPFLHPARGRGPAKPSAFLGQPGTAWNRSALLLSSRAA